jgi:hypothetical protein
VEIPAAVVTSAATSGEKIVQWPNGNGVREKGVGVGDGGRHGGSNALGESDDGRHRREGGDRFKSLGARQCRLGQAGEEDAREWRRLNEDNSVGDLFSNAMN